MHYGTRESFEYFECGSCGRLQVREIPTNLSKYYLDDYYSFRIKKIPGPNPVRTFCVVRDPNTVYLEKTKYGRYE